MKVYNLCFSSLRTGALACKLGQFNLDAIFSLFTVVT